MGIISSGRKRITDLNDTKALQLFLSSNQSKTQIYNTDTGAYAPDWTVNKPVISPELYIAGTPSNIIAQAKSISWYEDADGYPIANGTEYTLGTGNQPLTINRNVLAENYLKFDGSQYIGFGNTNGSTTITFEQWVIPSTVTPTSQSLFTKETSYKFRIGSGGTIQGLASTTGSSWTISTASWNANLVANTLYHIVATVDLVNGILQVYVNGTSLGQQTFTGSATPTLNAKSVNFGSFNDTVSSEMFKGKFLGGRIYNRVLTSTEVTNNYNGNITASGLVAQYLLTEGAGSTVGDSKGTANGTINTNARWNDPKKVITCEVVYTDPDTQTDVVTHGSIDFEKVQSGQQGPQGAAAPIGYLTNETAVVTTANDGTGGTYGAPNTATTLQIFLGATDVTNQYTIAQTRTNATVTEATTSATATVTNLTADTGSVTFTATRSGYPTITKTFSLAKTKMGVAGNNPTDYWLNSSVSVISAADSGAYTPSTVTFSAEAQVGTNAPTVYAGRFIIAESTDGTNFTTKYTSAADESSKAYTPSSGLMAVKVTLYQAGGTSVKLDDQTIMIVNNGKNSVTLSAWTPQGNVIRNAGNTVTAQADLYNGGLPDTGTNYRWVKGNGAATSVIAGAGYEDLDLGKNNLIPNSDFTVGSGGTQGWGGMTSIDTVGYNGVKGSTIVRTGYAGTNRAFISQRVAAGTLQSGAKYTLSAWIKINSSATFDDVSSSFFIRCYADNTATNFSDAISVNIHPTAGYDNWFFVSATGTYPSGYTGPFDCTFGLGYNGSVTISNWKLEAGTQATPWNKRFVDVTVDPTDNTLYGRNWVRNGDFAITTTNSSVGWDNTLNGTLISNAAWSNGYNGGVADPTHGYHAHLNSSKFGYPVLEFIDRNSTIGQTHRWLGLVNTLTSYDNFQFVQGQTYTLSYEVQTDTANMLINCGFYHYAIGSSTQAFNGFQWNFPQLTTTNTWTKQYKTFTVDNNWDVTKSANLYVYGNNSSVEGSMWVRNVKVEVGTIATDFSNDTPDNSANYPNQTAGIGKWLFKSFPTIAGTTHPTYSNVQSQATGLQKLIAESSNLVQGFGNNYTGYLKTTIYLPTAKTVAVSLQHDDGAIAYLNGVSIYQADSWASTPATITYNFQPGWNHIEFIWQQGTGGDGVYNISPAFGTIGEEMNSNYALDYGSLKGNYGLIGYNTSSMVVNTNAVTDTDLFMCYVSYRGSTYKDSVTIDDVTDPITIIINGAKLFKNGQGTNTYTANLYQNGAQIDPNGTIYTYTWYVYNSDGSKDNAFGGSGSKTGQTITLASSDINIRGRLQCTVSKQ